MRAWWVVIAMACSSEAPPPMPPAPPPPAVDASPLPAAPERPTRIARWSAGIPRAPQVKSLGCIRARDRMIQYAALASERELHVCIDWDLAKLPSGSSCWSVDLTTGAYVMQIGVTFASPQPLRVGDGGPSIAVGHATGAPLPLSDRAAEDLEPVFDDSNHLAAAALETGAIEIVDLVANKVIASVAKGSPAGFVGGSLVVTSCNDEGSKCAWNLVDARTGKTIAPVGGPAKFGAGGTADVIDDRQLVAVAGNALVIQDARTGAIIAKHTFPAAMGSYVAFARAADVIVAAPDGHVFLLDRETGAITKSFMPDPCNR